MRLLGLLALLLAVASRVSAEDASRIEIDIQVPDELRIRTTLAFNESESARVRSQAEMIPDGWIDRSEVAGVQEWAHVRRWFISASPSFYLNEDAPADRSVLTLKFDGLEGPSNATSPLVATGVESVTFRQNRIAGSFRLYIDGAPRHAGAVVSLALRSNMAVNGSAGIEPDMDAWQPRLFAGRMPDGTAEIRLYILDRVSSETPPVTSIPTQQMPESMVQPRSLVVGAGLGIAMTLAVQALWRARRPP